MKYDLQIGTVYNLSLLAPSVLGVEYKNATLIGLLDFQSAMLVMDVATLHANIYSSLPANTPSSPTDLIYLKIKSSTGEYRVVAEDWLSAIPEVVSSKTVQVTIKDMNLTDMGILRELLLKNGFPNFSIKTI